MIKINRSIDGQFYVTVTARNNEPLFTGEMLRTKYACKKQIAALCKAIIGYRIKDIEVVDLTKDEKETIYI